MTGDSNPERATAPTGREAILEAHQPFLEADLGLGRRLLLSSKHLEWHPRAPASPLIAELAQLQSVKLAARPVWESLGIGLVALTGIAFSSRLPVQGVLGAVAVLAMVACLLQRRYSMLLKWKSGRAEELFLGIGTPRAPVVERIEGVWSSVCGALQSMGVAAETERGAFSLGKSRR